MDTACIKEMGIFCDQKAIDVLDKEGYRVTLIGKDVEALMNRVVNPMSKLCKYGDELTLVYAVTKPIDGWLDDVVGIRQVDERFFEPLLANNYKDLYKISDPYGPMYASRYSIPYSNITLISCTPDDQVNAMYLPTLAGMRSDLIEKVVDVTVPSYPVLPYMNLHNYRIKIDHAAMRRISEPSTHLCSDTMKCTVKLPMANQG
ncbi:NAD-GH domain containing protein [Pyrenophora tritici-repentis]|nr:NAD-GH domain containing protein [Pyrenophora tritici-repentis]